MEILCIIAGQKGYQVRRVTSTSPTTSALQGITRVCSVIVLFDRYHPVSRIHPFRGRYSPPPENE